MRARDRVVVVRVLAPVLLALAAIVSLAPPARAARDLESLFPRRAEVSAEAAGLVRLTVPPEVLSASKPDLSDVRLIDSRGEEIAYLVDTGLPPERVREAGQTFAASILEAGRSIEERESAPSLLTETYVISAPPSAPEDGTWELRLSSRRSQFVWRIRVVAGRPRSDGRVLAEDASIFRLPDPRRENLSLPLPAFEAEELTVVLSGAGDSFLEPEFEFETRRRLSGSERATVELDIIEFSTFEDKTTARLERPRGLVPDTLLVATSTPVLNRRIEVWDEGPGAETTALADRLVSRLADEKKLEIPLRRARGHRLGVVIHNGGSPPLADLGFEAVVRQPALVFSIPRAPGGGGAATLLFGGGRAYAPRYDVAGLVPRRDRLEGEAARTAEAVFDGDKQGVATLSAIRDNPAWDAEPALAFAMRPGPAVNRRAYSHAALVTAPESREGLLRFEVPPAVAAEARGDLGDVRLIDAEDRQWPYLLERDAASEEIALYAGPPDRDDGSSRYQMSLPFEPLRIEQLIVDSSDQFFDRRFEVVGIPAGAREETVLAEGRLVRPLGDPRQVRVALRDVAVESLSLVIHDGDDPPLAGLRLALRVPVSTLYFTAPRGRYTLLYGNPEETAPQYELARVRDVVLATRPVEANLGSGSENAAFSVGARLSSGSGLQKVLLWGALGIVVTVLAWLTLRLARQD